jgi:xanthine dehydrogenase large subunit
MRSNALSTYKIPDIYSCRKRLKFRRSKRQRKFGDFYSKAVGEPPLMYGLGAYFAIREAVKAFNSENLPAFDAPCTPEKVLLNLYSETVKQMKAER